MRSNRLLPAIRLLLPLLFTLPGPALAEWGITKAEVRWGYPPDWTTIAGAIEQAQKDIDASDNISGTTPVKLLNVFRNHEWDIPDGGRKDTVARRTSEYFAQIAQAYSRAGFPEPTYLPKNEAGNAYLLYFYNFNTSFYDAPGMGYDATAVGARVTTPCTKADLNGKNADGKPVTGLFALNTPYLVPRDEQGLSDKVRGYLYITIAHELFHAVQNMQELNDDLDACKGPYAWAEATANAVGTWMADQPSAKWRNKSSPYYPDPRNPIANEGHYDFRFNWMELTFGKDDENSHGGRANAYALNPLFRFAMERRGLFSDKKPGLDVATLFLEGLKEMKPNSSTISDDQQDKWWNNRLRTAPEPEAVNSKEPEAVNSKPRSTMELGIYFAEMLAHHADSWDRYNESEQDWGDALFDGCLDVTLDRSNSWAASGIFDIKNNTARCVDVTIEDLKPNQCFTVYANASVPSAEARGEGSYVVDSLHLSVPALGGQVEQDGWKTYDCRTLSESGPGGMCTGTPMTLNRKVADLNKEPPDKYKFEREGAYGSGASASPPGWYRTWQKNRQRADNSTVENRYILAFVTGGGLSLRNKEHVVDLKFGTDITNDVEVDGKSPEQCGGGGAGALQGAVSPHPAIGDSTALMTDMRLAPFFTWLPDLRQVDDLPDEGVSLFTVREFGPETAESSMEGQSQFMFVVEPPIPFGAKGRFKAGVGGQRLGSQSIAFLQNIGDEPSGYVDVVRFDEEVLHVNVGGEYCIFEAGDTECRGRHTISAELIRPFGWTYDRAQTPTAVFTPGMEQYAREIEEAMQGQFPGMMPGFAPGIGGGPGGPGRSSGPSGSPSGSGSSTGGSWSCDCSCDEIGQMEQLADAVNNALDGIDEEIPEDIAALVDAGGIATVMQCTTKCMQQYAMCEQDGAMD